ncbi:MAG: phosphoesterase, partial [Atopobiaceae bacterium]|nr:phosphoesterase [Atopobiaceae bacterium]
MHCHILPGVDDGARSLEESLKMLEAAKRAGITSITCTPHC